MLLFCALLRVWFEFVLLFDVLCGVCSVCVCVCLCVLVVLFEYFDCVCFVVMLCLSVVVWMDCVDFVTLSH